MWVRGLGAGQGWKRSKCKDANGREHDGIIRELKAPEALVGVHGGTASSPSAAGRPPCQGTAVEYTRISGHLLVCLTSGIGNRRKERCVTGKASGLYS